MANPGVGGKTILVVDDDEGVLAVAEAVLVRAGYSVIAFSNPLVALSKSREVEGEIHLLLTDVAMPGMDGLQLARLIQAERPETRVLLMSGYLASPSRFPLVMKPFALNDLLSRVASAMTAVQPPPDVPAGVNQIRNDRLEEARKNYLDSSREFHRALNEVPTGLPATDGAAFVRSKAKLRRQAFAEYKRALDKAGRRSSAPKDRHKPREQQ